MKIVYCTFFLLLNMSCMAGRSKKHIYILPENFQGVVVIFYGQKNGNTVEYDKDGNIVFRISKNGILKTQLDFAPNAL